MLVNNLAVIVRHLPKLQSVSVGCDKFYQDWNAIKYPQTASLIYALFDQINLVNTVMSGYTLEKDKFLVELVKRNLTDGQQRALSFLKFGYVRDAWIGMRLVAELVKGASQVQGGFGVNFPILIGEMRRQYLATNQLWKWQPGSHIVFC